MIKWIVLGSLTWESKPYYHDQWLERFEEVWWFGEALFITSSFCPKEASIKHHQILIPITSMVVTVKSSHGPVPSTLKNKGKGKAPQPVHAEIPLGKYLASTGKFTPSSNPLPVPCYLFILLFTQLTILLSSHRETDSRQSSQVLSCFPSQWISRSSTITSTPRWIRDGQVMERYFLLWVLEFSSQKGS